MQDGTTLLCKYTKQTDALRVIATVMGTPQVIYYRFTDQGIQDNNGNVLLSPEKYAAAIEQQRQAQIEEQNKQLEEQRKQLEEQRIAEVIAKSKQETQTITTFSLAPREVPANPNGNTVYTGRVLIKWNVTLTDVSLKCQTVRILLDEGNYTMSEDSEVFFCEIRKIGNVGEEAPSNGFLLESANNWWPPYKDEKPPILSFQSEADARAAHDTVLNAYNAWKAKFPEAVLK